MEYYYAFVLFLCLSIISFDFSVADLQDDSSSYIDDDQYYGRTLSKACEDCSDSEKRTNYAKAEVRAKISSQLGVSQTNVTSNVPDYMVKRLLKRYRRRQLTDLSSRYKEDGNFFRPEQITILSKDGRSEIFNFFIWCCDLISYSLPF